MPPGSSCEPLDEILTSIVDVVFGRANNRQTLEQALLASSYDPEASVTDRLDADTALRFRSRLHDAFGDLANARQVLERVAVVLGQLDNPDRNLSASAGTYDY
jgi:hypothetical protein